MQFHVLKSGLFAIGVVWLAGASIQAQGQPLGVGEAETMLLLPAGNHPEGIVFDEDGVLFVGNRRDGEGFRTAEILKVDVDGTVSLYAELGAAPAGTSGLLGLAVQDGDLFAANVTFDPASHGVFQITKGGGRIERLAGSEAMVFPNGLTFDDQERLYVTDSVAGTVWRFAPEEGGAGEVWAQHDLLAPLAEDPYGFPLPGANGIAWHRDELYVANTEKGLIASISIETNGVAGPVNLVAFDFLLATVDGIAVDGRGDVHGVVPGSAVLGTSPVVRVDTLSGEVTATVTDPDEIAKFNDPLSVAFGSAPTDRKAIFVTNGDLGFTMGGPAAGVVRVGVGAR